MKKEKILTLPPIMLNQKMCIKWNSKISGIYAWVNEVNGKMYIGQSVNFYKRIYNEMSGFRNKRNQNMIKLFYAIQKHGIENFRVIRLLECSKEYLNKLERLLIEYYNSYKNGYNCNIGGDGNSGHVVSKEQREKHRRWLKEYYTDDRRQKHSEKMKVWFNSKSKDEQDKMKSGNDWWLNKGCKEKHLENTHKSLTKDRIERQRKSLLEYYKENDSKKMIKMDIISPENKIVKIDGLNEFCKKYNIGKKGIDDVINGNRKHHKGWHVDPDFVFYPIPLKKIISPDSKLYEFQSTVKFCREYNLQLSSIKHVLNKKYKHYKLWRLPNVSLEEAINNKNFVYKNIQFKFQDNHTEKILDKVKFCKKYGYSPNYLYKFLKNKNVGDMFHGLKLISK